MSLRQIIALGSLANALVALYLHLWKLGLMGSLACSNGGGCAYVQGSPYSWFLGVDVALIGTVGYTVLFLVSALGTLSRFEDTRWVTRVMQVLIWAAVLFTLRLKYGEFIVLKSFCSWCAISAVSITLFAVLVTLDWKRVTRAMADSH
ncbi:MAG: vitamin K epoxide reductase family protein [Gemmatimonadaceae bacterium]|nr:vitamin K epoxide reductase family protein [Gemmatimonadaceae bacterium]